MRGLRPSTVTLLCLAACAGEGGGDVPRATGDAGVAPQPALLALTVEGGVLVPAFDPEIVDYRTALPPTSDAVRVDAVTPPGVSATVDGSAVPYTFSLEVGEERMVVVEVGRAERTYRLRIRRDASYYLKAFQAGRGDEFGRDLDVDGDLLAVGAPGEDSDATGVNGPQDNDNLSRSGAVYLYRYDGVTWRPEAFLKASRPGVTDGFGFRVAVSGDTVAVAAPFEDSNASLPNGDQANDRATDSGAVYVFERDEETGWRQTAYLKPWNVQFFSFFGVGLALFGDTLAVGAEGEPSGDRGVGADPFFFSPPLGRSGAVFLFERTGTGWIPSTFIKAENAGAGDQFGTSVSMDETTLVVGANIEDGGSRALDGDDLVSGAGAAYVYSRGPGGWVFDAYLKAPDADSSPALGAQFGWSVAVDGDRIVVGAPWRAGSGVLGSLLGGALEPGYSGAAYVFRRRIDGWTFERLLTSPTPGTLDRMGYDVDIAGDLVSTGVPDDDALAITPTRDPLRNGAVDAGGLLLFDGGDLPIAVDATNPETGFRTATSADNLLSATRHALSPDWVVFSSISEPSDASGVGGDQWNRRAPFAGAVYAMPRTLVEAVE